MKNPPNKKMRKKMANMCFMVIDELDEVNSNFSDEVIHDVFEELYEDFEKPSLKNNSLKKKIQDLENELEEVKEQLMNYLKLILKKKMRF